ncbi:hypothetical protein ACIQMJ_28275 [Actinosynnema sp. NPDC091369]
MAWIDDLDQLRTWLEQPGVDRIARVRLMVLAATGLGYYAEGEADVSGGSITGQLTRTRNSDRWDPYPNDGWPDSYPFDPKGVDKITLTVSLSTGAVTVGGTTFPQPASLAGASLVTASVVAGVGVMRQLSLSMIGHEQGDPK